MGNVGSILTIGHSTHLLETFVGLLHRYQVTVVADVRSVPYSQFQPQFNRESLKESLKKENIGYVFLGEELGARSKDPLCYVDGKVQYRELAKTQLFQQGLQRLLKGRENHRIALMCAEREPLDCHRTLLVARELVAKGVAVSHIHADGHLETHQEAQARLLRIQHLLEQDLFRSPAEVLDEAYALQENRVAYVDGMMVKEDEGGQ
jgi:uncharacterized protein (DUF488 family)